VAKRRFFVSSGGGGIDPGNPFAVDQILAVQQVSPPIANTTRLGRKNDATKSLIAPGVNAGALSFVMGDTVVDSVMGLRSVLIGANITQNNPAGLAGQAADQVLIGNALVLPTLSRNSQGLVAIGAAQTYTAFLGVADSFGESVIIGHTATLLCLNAGGGDASNAVAIGPGSIATGGTVAIGANARASDLTAVCIGQGSKAGLQSVAIGLNADSTGARNISIGDRARGGVANSGTVVIGWFADGANSDSGIAIGQSANLNGKTASIMLGRNASVALDFFCQIGGDQTYPINEMRFGAGFTAATGGNTYTFGITTVFGGAGNNLAGNGLLIRSGLGTGNWANAQGLGIDLQCGLVQAGGSTQQPYTSVLALRHSDLNVALWGGMGATFGGGVLCLFIKNATTVPTVAPTGGGLLYVTGGALHWLGSGGTDTTIAAA
jgi:hypothetical protein